MARCFNSFRNDNPIARDDLGIDLPSLEDARQAALSSARELVADNVRAAQTGLVNPAAPVVRPDRQQGEHRAG